MKFDWDKYWGELDAELDKPEGQRNESVRLFAEELALAIHKRQMQILERRSFKGVSDE
jgi:hypothetical protein